MRLSFPITRAPSALPLASLAALHSNHGARQKSQQTVECGITARSEERALTRRPPDTDAFLRVVHAFLHLANSYIESGTGMSVRSLIRTLWVPINTSELVRLHIRTHAGFHRDGQVFGHRGGRLGPARAEARVAGEAVGRWRCPGAARCGGTGHVPVSSSGVPPTGAHAPSVRASRMAPSVISPDRDPGLIGVRRIREEVGDGTHSDGRRPCCSRGRGRHRCAGGGLRVGCLRRRARSRRVDDRLFAVRAVSCLAYGIAHRHRHSARRPCGSCDFRGDGVRRPSRIGDVESQGLERRSAESGRPAPQPAAADRRLRPLTYGSCNACGAVPAERIRQAPPSGYRSALPADLGCDHSPPRRPGTGSDQMPRPCVAA